MGKLKSRMRTLGWLGKNSAPASSHHLFKAHRVPDPAGLGLPGGHRARADFWGLKQAGVQIPENGDEKAELMVGTWEVPGPMHSEREAVPAAMALFQPLSCPHKARNGTGNPKPPRDKSRASSSGRGTSGPFPGLLHPKTLTLSLLAWQPLHTQIFVSLPLAK